MKGKKISLASSRIFKRSQLRACQASLSLRYGWVYIPKPKPKPKTQKCFGWSVCPYWIIIQRNSTPLISTIVFAFVLSLKSVWHRFKCKQQNELKLTFIWIIIIKNEVCQLEHGIKNKLLIRIENNIGVVAALSCACRCGLDKSCLLEQVHVLLYLSHLILLDYWGQKFGIGRQRLYLLVDALSRWHFSALKSEKMKMLSVCIEREATLVSFNLLSFRAVFVFFFEGYLTHTEKVF